MTHDRFPREPLTPDEQALARRLAQLGSQAEPSPALDARILAAARAAEGVRSPRLARRWPVALGVAASLVLAVGIAWRLRPLPGPSERYSTAPAAASRQAPSAPPATASESEPVTVAPPPHDTAAFVEPPPPPAVKAVPARAAPPSPVVAAAPASEPPVVLEAPAPAAPMAPATLPAPPPASDEPETQAGGNAAPARKAAASQATEDAGFDAAAAADRAAGDEPESEVPPATADSPDVREAWLQRIRELVASGQTDAARASLKEFVHRHPDAPLPDDLRALQR